MGMLSKKDMAHIRVNAWCDHTNEMPDALRARYIRVEGIYRWLRLSRDDAIRRWANLSLEHGQIATLEYGDGAIIDVKRG
ncbi:hypothetical protein HMI48_00785 [Acidithiobacillus ferrooxidans]|uniref:hypothetical protein n=1 Tax=Acidithiobacillus ferrooxidans TaxID=920 RepID=UPI001C07CADC|nr:hypothetical protein [Acidithiobacillus ferrooxidans]MBU2772497.1 hypothetical protein [Acidithiobacillus ferrooxidans]MCR1345327.1 hypothetical protein [Acidithiobacillus ferrooxidans]MCR1354487.1 hypothetical protein [Acidithiobacillus ferrooxidans]MDA8378387.1 hypothetical protein [Planctomycetia bacterium]